MVSDLLDRFAAATPDKTYIRFADGVDWSYAALRREARRMAAGLQALGLRQGDRLLAWLPNSPDMVRLYFAASYAGATLVPINLAYRGGLLAHVIANAEARLMVVHGGLVERLADVALGALERLVVVGPTPGAVPAGLAHLPATALTAGGEEPAPLPRPVESWDSQLIIYTSGTTGPSKGALGSYAQAWATGEALHFLGPDDRMLVNLPLFHVGGTNALYMMLRVGGSVALIEAFDTASFWPTIRDTGTTVVGLLGAMATFLLKATSGPGDRDHALRTIITLPLTEDALRLAGRFGVTVYTGFNMTEVSGPIFSGPNPDRIGSCGRLRAGFEARLVDADDQPVADGEVGELILRADRPWVITPGYHGMPEATARAWRNGWFHTGDGFRRDADGNYFFVDRLKDAIRRRGENISSFEVEAEVRAHPDVREAAAVAVPSPEGEDEVLVVVAPVAGRSIDPPALLQFLIPRMAHFMVPRFVRVMDDLPKTPTAKVQKHLLRQITADTWDREAAGIRVRREKLN